MNSNEYLNSVLEKYSTSNGHVQKIIAASNELSPFIKEWANEFLIDLSYSGSFAKNTAIAGESDLDLLISLSSTTPATLKEIFDSLQNFLIRRALEHGGKMSP